MLFEFVSMRLVAKNRSKIAFHALKNEIRRKFDARNSNQIDYQANWLLFAQHMGAAAVERSLARTLFNPMQFQSFLNSFLDT